MEEGAKTPVRDDEASGPAAQTEQRPLGQQLTDESRARRAQREPNGNLLPPRRRPRHQQRRDARTRDQHDDRDDGHQHAERALVAMPEPRETAARADQPNGSRPTLGIRSANRLLELLEDERRARLRAGLRDARRAAAENRQPVRLT